MEAATTPKQSEDERVYDFRWTCCRELGLNPDQADLVASSRQINMHDFTDLLEKGCPIHLAFSICS